MTHRTVATLLLLCLSNTALSEPSKLTIGEEIAFGDSQPALVSKLQDYCENLTNVESSQPAFPLAKTTEQHLVCKGYKKDTIQFDKAAFIIADNEFVHMEAHLNDIESIVEALGEQAATYIGMEVYAGGSYWLNRENNTLIWLTKDALHPNLFAWNNPVLMSAPGDYEQTTEIPSLLNFDADIDTLRPHFEQRCKYVQEDIIDSIWLPNQPERQVQINCFGYEYAGFERKFEAVFGDGQLQVVWVLSGQQEEQRIRQQLLADWGPAEITNPKWEVFAGGKISLRKDKPELLILADEMIPFYQTDFAQN